MEEASDGRGAWRVVVDDVADTPTVERRFLASATRPVAATGLVVVERVVVVPEEDVLVVGLWLAAAEVEEARVSFRAAAAVPTAAVDDSDCLAVGLVAVDELAVVVWRATVECPSVLFFSSPDADGFDLCVAVNPEAAGRLARVGVAPAAGRVGGLLRPLPTALVRDVDEVTAGLVGALLAKAARRVGVAEDVVPMLDVRFASPLAAAVFVARVLGAATLVPIFVAVFSAALGLADASAAGAGAGSAAGSSTGAGASTGAEERGATSCGTGSVSLASAMVEARRRLWQKYALGC